MSFVSYPSFLPRFIFVGFNPVVAGSAHVKPSFSIAKILSHSSISVMNICGQEPASGKIGLAPSPEPEHVCFEFSVFIQPFRLFFGYFAERYSLHHNETRAAGRRSVGKIACMAASLISSGISSHKRSLSFFNALCSTNHNACHDIACFFSPVTSATASHHDAISFSVRVCPGSSPTADSSSPSSFGSVFIFHSFCLVLTAKRGSKTITVATF